MNAPTPTDWTTEFSKDDTFPNGITFPFVEDENANITGLGHQDEAEFLRLVNVYDAALNGEPVDEWIENCGYELVAYHCWVVLGPDDEHLHSVLDGVPVTYETPGALPVTAIWGQRD